MPHRLVCVAIMVAWAFAAVALFRRDLLPNLLVEPPPDLRTIAQAEDTARPVHWAILVADDVDVSNPRSAGQVVTKAERKRDGWITMTSDASIDAGELLRGTPFDSGPGEKVEIGGEFDIDEVGNLDHFRAWVRPGDGSRKDLMTISGKVKKERLVVQIHGPLPWMNGPQSFPYKPRGMVQGSLGPLERMPGLHLGQRWETRVVSPMTGRVDVGRVEVARKHTIYWDKSPVTTFEVVTRLGNLSARTWVRASDGLVLRQEVPFPLARLMLERVPDRLDVPPGGSQE